MSSGEGEDNVFDFFEDDEEVENDAKSEEP